MARQQLIAGNWKMNGTRDALAFFQDIAPAAAASTSEILICPPATLVAAGAAACANSPVKIGGQDCHSETSGAHTGDISAVMLRDARPQLWHPQGHRIPQRTLSHVARQTIQCRFGRTRSGLPNLHMDDVTPRGFGLAGGLHHVHHDKGINGPAP